jgi:ribosome-associated protein
MTQTQNFDKAGQLVHTIIKGIQEVKGHDIACLDLRKLTHSIADYFIICHGNSSTQVEAIARSVQKETEVALDERPWHKEGMTNAEWILLDYGNVVVHVFLHDQRAHYGLEELWADAETKLIEQRA